MPSVATLNFHTKDCQLDDGSWINLDCPVYKYSTLWNLSSFSDANGLCSYEKPINTVQSAYNCDDHISWEYDWEDLQMCHSKYLWKNDVGSGFVEDANKLEDVKVLCNSGDYLSLLSKTGDDAYTLVFLTTHDDKEDIAATVPSTGGKYCTAMWVVLEFLRKDMQVDGRWSRAYERLPSACPEETQLEPFVYTRHLVQWGGKGYGNSVFDGGKCDDPLSNLTAACSGGEIFIVDISVNPDVFNHDCKINPNDKREALCSSSGSLSTASFECHGQGKNDLKLTATLKATAVDCIAEARSAEQMLYMASHCEDWIDLDDDCSTYKTAADSENNRNVCSSYGSSSCTSSPSHECSASLSDVTLMSIAQDDEKCVHSSDEKTTTTTISTTLVDLKPDTEEATTTATTMYLTQQDEDDPEQYSIFTAYTLSWAGQGYKNSGVQEWYQPGKCSDPDSDLTVQCSGGEIVIDPDNFEHDCEIDPADKSKEQSVVLFKWDSQWSCD
eukprot:scaffold53813_cov83-Cyclotella_meneghiniana.AAC.1